MFNLFIKFGSRKASSGGVRYQFWSNPGKKTQKQGSGHRRTGMVRSPETCPARKGSELVQVMGSLVERR